MRLNAFIQAVKAADIKKKPHDGTFESPRLIVVETTRLQPKHTQLLAVVLTKSDIVSFSV